MSILTKIQNWINIINQFFCKHQYKVLSVTDTYDVYYVCPKCGKITVIYYTV